MPKKLPWITGETNKWNWYVCSDIWIATRWTTRFGYDWQCRAVEKNKGINNEQHTNPPIHQGSHLKTNLIIAFIISIHPTKTQILSNIHRKPIWEPWPKAPQSNWTELQTHTIDVQCWYFIPAGLQRHHQLICGFGIWRDWSRFCSCFKRSTAALINRQTRV